MLPTPASASACTANDRANDGGLVSFCVATKTWKRAALSSW
ncbi:hypothetical protein [Methylobacterium variabile]|nr:hypothetical protein [Methylobacterium variabile]